MTLLTRYLGIDIKRTADRFLLPHAKQIKSLYDKAQAYLECSMDALYSARNPHPRPRKSRRPQINGIAGIHREHCYKLQAEAIWGCNLDLDRKITMIGKALFKHMPPEAAFKTQARCCPPDVCIPYAYHRHYAACVLASSPKH